MKLEEKLREEDILLDAAAQKLANAGLYRIPDRNGSRIIHKQRLLEDAIKTFIPLAALAILSWVAVGVLNGMKADKDEIIYRQDLQLKAAIVMMEGMKLAAQDMDKLRVRAENNAGFIHDHLKSKPPPNLILQAPEYWKNKRIEDFIPMRIERK